MLNRTKKGGFHPGTVQMFGIKILIQFTSILTQLAENSNKIRKERVICHPREGRLSLTLNYGVWTLHVKSSCITVSARSQTEEFSGDENGSKNNECLWSGHLSYSTQFPNTPSAPNFLPQAAVCIFLHHLCLGNSSHFELLIPLYLTILQGPPLSNHHPSLLNVQKQQHPISYNLVLNNYKVIYCFTVVVFISGPELAF